MSYQSPDLEPAPPPSCCIVHIARNASATSGMSLASHNPLPLSSYSARKGPWAGYHHQGRRKVRHSWMTTLRSSPDSPAHSGARLGYPYVTPCVAGFFVLKGGVAVGVKVVEDEDEFSDLITRRAAGFPPCNVRRYNLSRKEANEPAGVLRSPSQCPILQLLLWLLVHHRLILICISPLQLERGGKRDTDEDLEITREDGYWSEEFLHHHAHAPRSRVPRVG